MSQQQPQYGSGAQSGAQTGAQGFGGQEAGRQFAGRLPTQQRSALLDVARAVEVCEWCADQCVQEANPNMIECIRLCEDVAELGESTLTLLPRNSRFGQSVAGSFQQAIQACAQECSRHQQAHCQECARILSEVMNSTQQLVQQPPQ